MLNKIKIGDVVTVAVILLAAALLWLLWRPGGTVSGAVLSVMGEKTEISLNGLSGETVTRTVIGKDGLILKLEMHGNAVRICESQCPDQVCVRTGWLSRAGATAVCVPAEVILELKGGEEPDALSG